MENICVFHSEVRGLKSGVVDHERLIDEMPLTLERVTFAFNVVSPGGAFGKRMLVFIINKRGIGVHQGLELLKSSSEGVGSLSFQNGLGDVGNYNCKEKRRVRMVKLPFSLGF